MDSLKGSGIVGARRRLDSVLDGLVDRSQESASSAPDDNSSEIVLRETAMGLLQLPNRTPEATHALSQSKRATAKSPRKRRRRDPGGGVVVESHVMKLFDRSVDLARFSEETPVYVICRDWMRNLNPPGKNSFCDSDPMMGLDLLSSASMLDGHVWTLPAARPVSEDDCRAVGPPAPPPLDVTKASVDKALDAAVNASSNETQVSTHTLLQGNMKRWRKQRQLKRRLVQLENERYHDSWIALQGLRQDFA